MVAMLHFVPEEPGAHAAVERYRELLPAGSRLIISHVTKHDVPGELRGQLEKFVNQYEESSTPCRFRTPEEIRAFFGDFDLVEPGLVWLPQWHLDEDTSPYTAADFTTDPRTACVLGGVGIKP
jgi:hypothetical protein